MIELNKLPIYILKRYLLLLVGLSIMAFGVAFSIKASLGTSPISSVPYVVSLFTPLTVGTATITMHCVFILLQILILRKNYHPIQLMQLPVAFFFGYLTDFGVWAVQGITCNTYWQQWIVCLIGILLVAVGVSFEVKAGVVVLAGEGVVLAICKVLPKVKFGYMKVGFDVTLVVIACILSIVFTGRLQGVREGTVAAALLVGLIAKQLGKLLARWKLEEI
ncbi:YitT family protein [Mediterraneibacter glycyrrhizinilyticus]|nr:YitT family protein [Mediterraneibacter glycyrrhizinilyticus]